MLSKNQTGMVITLSMVLGVAICCVGARLLQKRVQQLKGYKKTARDDSFRPGFEDDEVWRPPPRLLRNLRRLRPAATHRLPISTPGPATTDEPAPRAC